MEVTKIGFIGLGSMGDGMTKNLLKAGYAVSGYDVNPDAVARLAEAGGMASADPAACAADADMLIVCVFSAEQANAVLFGDKGAAAVLKSGATVVMSTTMAPDACKAIAGRLEKTGHLFIDAPVTGGKRGADLGTLTVIAAGSDAAMAAAEGPFKAMGDRVYHVGDSAGAASSVKMINQLLVGTHVAAAAEAIALAARAGADPAVVYDVITHGAGNSVAFETRIPNILAGDFTPRGVVDIFIKDLGIVAETGRALRFPLPIASAALQQFLAASAAGHGGKDDGAVVKVYEQLSGVDVAGAVKKKD